MFRLLSRHASLLSFPARASSASIIAPLASSLSPAAALFSSSSLSVDLRSDTKTQPSPGQRRAMAEAVVGDDVMGEDPTVNRLEARVAALLGKEAGIFVPTGTMGNLAALAVHCPRGHSVVLGDKSHIYMYEACGASALLGVPMQLLPNEPDGTLAGRSVDPIRAAIWPDDQVRGGRACVRVCVCVCGPAEGIGRVAVCVWRVGELRWVP